MCLFILKHALYVASGGSVEKLHRLHRPPISQLPKLCVKISIFMQGHVLIADWSVAHFVVVMNDNMAALPMSALVWVRSFIGPDF